MGLSKGFMKGSLEKIVTSARVGDSQEMIIKHE